MDDGRKWAGDLYEEGPVTDPGEAYGALSGDGDVEAWLDRNDDGTLTGWVREGDQVWRYSDPEAWALDVDGAQMQMVSQAPPVPGEEPVDGEGGELEPTEAEGNPAETEVPTDGDTPAEDPFAEPDPEAEAEAALGADQESTDEFENPFAIPDDEDEDDEAEPDAFAAEEPADAEEDDDTDDEPAEDDEAPADAPGPADGDAADDADEDEDEGEDGPESEKDKLFKRGQKKTLEPGILPGPTRAPRGTVRITRGR